LPHTDIHFVDHGDREKPYVALTFDLCQKPDLPSWFDQGIYSVLIKYDVPATFFMGGDWMRTHLEETLLLASNPKFELGNHSWSHPDLPGLSEEIISKEIVKTQDMLYQLTGRQSRLFRLPAGLYDDLTLSVIAWHGLYTIQWDVETGDPDPTIDAERMNWAVQERVQNGSIIIMHANGRGWHTAEALPEMIEYLQGQGYTLVTVSQLLGLEPISGQ
jgi:peptidoglycan/xylan/chitin deacetylase (PgdA/CDA1 family)